jgi:glycosyltransferase involved in cell wall biosynthesis
VKQLLAISWEMPPLSGPRAVQVTRTLAALGTRGWSSRVICFRPRSNRYHQDHHVSLEEMSGGRASQVGVPSPEEWFPVRALWRLAPPLKRFPDEKRVWMPAALDAARRALQAGPVDVIVSFAQPFTDHLIGLRLRHETGLPWVAHFSDPWADSPYLPGGSAARRRAMTWEREVIAAATRVVFVTRRTRERVMEKYPRAWAAKADVVPQAFDPAPSASVAPRLDTSRPMRVVYTGRFYDGIRTPLALLDAVARMHGESSLAGRLELEFIGADMTSYAARAASLGLESFVSFSGRLSPADARARAATADLLLVIDAPASDGGLFLPSKLIEYLPLRRPILGLTPAEGPSDELIQELGYQTVAPNDVNAIAAALDGLLRAHSSGRLVPSLQHDTVSARFSVAATADKFAAVLDRALGPS